MIGYGLEYCLYLFIRLVDCFLVTAATCVIERHLWSDRLNEQIPFLLSTLHLARFLDDVWGREGKGVGKWSRQYVCLSLLSWRQCPHCNGLST